MVQITTLVTLEKVLVDFFLFIPSPSSKKCQIHHTSFLKTPQITEKTFKEYLEIFSRQYREFNC